MYPAYVTPEEATEIRASHGLDGDGFPHCNAEVLHAPGECVFCDLYPTRQQMRAASGAAFATLEANGWGGNVAVPVAGQGSRRWETSPTVSVPVAGQGNEPTAVELALVGLLDLAIAGHIEGPGLVYCGGADRGGCWLEAAEALWDLLATD